MLTAGSSILDVDVGVRLAVLGTQTALTAVRDSVATTYLTTHAHTELNILSRVNTSN